MSNEQRYPGLLILLIGPSGAGKSSIITKLMQRHPEWHRAQSATTRPRRQGESPDAFRFVSDAEFDRMAADGKLLEWQTVHGRARYGTLTEEILPKIEQGKVVIREIETNGFDAIRNDPRFKRPDGAYPLLSVFIMPENLTELRQRIKRRTSVSHAELQRRMDSMTQEMTYAPLCDAQVQNADGKLDQAVEAVERAISGD